MMVLRVQVGCVAALALALGCSREKETSTDDMRRASADAGPGAPERPCHLTVGGPPSVLVPLASEIGQKIEVARGTACVVLDAAPSLTRVRITDGPYAGTVAWTQSGTVAIDSMR
jgi:hypothetical protein